MVCFLINCSPLESIQDFCFHIRSLLMRYTGHLNKKLYHGQFIKKKLLVKLC